MRRTLERIGIGEAEFLLACDASFKQGSRFDGWVTGAPDDRYFHPDMRVASSLVKSGAGDVERAGAVFGGDDQGRGRHGGAPQSGFWMRAAALSGARPG